MTTNDMNTAEKAAETFLDTLRADALASLSGRDEFAEFNVDLMKTILEGRKLDFRDHAELMGVGVEISGVLSMLSTTINHIITADGATEATIEEGTKYLAQITTGAVARAMFEGAVFAARQGYTEAALRAMCPEGRAGQW